LGQSGDELSVEDLKKELSTFGYPGGKQYVTPLKKDGQRSDSNEWNFLLPGEVDQTAEEKEADKAGSAPVGEAMPPKGSGSMDPSEVGLDAEMNMEVD
jgi:hypothetical protein